MKFNLERAFEQTSANNYFISLRDKKAFVEIKEITSGTEQQNRYFHLILGWFSFEYGENMAWVKKNIVKKIVCPEIFITEISSKKTGEIDEDLRSWSDLTKPERKIVIDRFRDYASKEAGIYLPNANEQGLLESLEIELEKNKQWL